MNDAVVLLVDADADRRQALSALFPPERFRVLGAASLESARRAALVSPRLVVLSQLEGNPSLAPFISVWRADPENARVPLVVVAPAGDPAAAEAALAAGADDVLPWPTDEAFLRGRIRALDEVSRLRAEVGGFEAVLSSVVDGLEAREPYSIEHSRRVGFFGIGMARTLGLSTEEIQRIGRASRVYDIGMFAIPDRLLYGDQVLSREELAEVRSHPVVGYDLLRGVPSFESMLPFVHRHHERIDGSGYPDGLVGREIPVPVQVLSLADAFDVLTSARPYRARRPSELALEILRSESRRGAWDGELVSALERVLQAPAAA